MDCPALVPAIVKCIGVQPREHRSSAWRTVGGKEQQQVPSAPEFTIYTTVFHTNAVTGTLTVQRRHILAPDLSLESPVFTICYKRNMLYMYFFSLIF